MSLAPGQKLAHYEVVEPIGKGGMGEVYRAKDAKLGRDVAIKVLPDEFAEDEERLRRFQREAKLLASLNHPGIAAIYGLEQVRKTHYLVLELVPGETLAERIARGPIPVDEALEIAVKIAEALEDAHEHGIAHRDLKPANVKLTDEGKVKILDFGLAKALTEESGDGDSSASMSPTFTRDSTRAGMILGTAAYMSPEQAKGRRIDRRTDIFAFGALLFEMLTGKKAFPGEDVSEVLAAVIKSEPDWDALGSDVPHEVRRLVRRCLTKDKSLRLQHIGDARIELIDRGDAARSNVSTTVGAVPPWARFASIAVLSAIAAWGWLRSSSPPDALPTYLEMDIPSGRLWGGHPDEVRIGGQRPSRPSFVIAPDGRSIVYAATGGDDDTRLYLRRLGEPVPIPMTGTEGASSPFFSPDGAWVGFLADSERTLKRVEVGGGQPITIHSGWIFAPSWAGKDSIFFTGDGFEIYVIPSSGGTPRPVTTRRRESRESFHAFPQLLADGKTLLYTVIKGAARFYRESEIVAQTAASEPVVLVQNAIGGRYLPSGHLVFARQGTLMAVALDVEALAVVGEPVRVIEDVMQALLAANSSIDTGTAQFAVSDSGTLAYATGGLHEVRATTPLWVDFAGREEPLPLAPSYALYNRLSPDDRKLAMVSGFEERQLVVADVESGATIRQEIGSVQGLAWSPDGKRLAVSIGDEERPVINIHLVDPGGREPPERLTSGERLELVQDWSALNVIAFLVDRDIWTLEVDRDDEARAFVSGPASEVLAAFSPDGRWLAYASDESGREEIYVRPYPEAEPVHRVSRDGGSRPLWSRDGRTLFYRSGVDNRTKMMAVDVSTAGGALRATRVRELFDRPYLGTTSRRSYDVTADGRFLLMEAWYHPVQPVTRLQVVLNWFSELERLVPTK